MHSYSFATQKDLVLCALMLHNFIRAHAVYEDPFDAEYIQDLKDQEDDIQEVDIAGSAANARQLYAWRDEIALSMWVDYQAGVAQRG